MATKHNLNYFWKRDNIVCIALTNACMWKNLIEKPK